MTQDDIKIFSVFNDVKVRISPTIDCLQIGTRMLINIISRSTLDNSK